MKERLAALKAFVSPTNIFGFKKTPPTMEQRLDYLLKNPEILDDYVSSDEKSKASMLALLTQGLDEKSGAEVNNGIQLLQKIRQFNSKKPTPTLNEMIDFLKNNPEIPTKGPIVEGMLELFNNHLDSKNKILLGNEIRIINDIKAGVKNNPTPAKRAVFLYDNRDKYRLDEYPKILLAGLKNDEQHEVLDGYLKKLSGADKENLLVKLITAEKDRALNSTDPNTFMRGTSIYKLAMMYPIRKKIEENPQLIDQFIENPINFINNMEIPHYLKPLLGDVIQEFIDQGKPLTEFTHNIIFALAAGPITDYSRKKIGELKEKLETAKKENDTLKIKEYTEELKKYEEKNNRVTRETGELVTKSYRMLCARSELELRAKQVLEAGVTNHNLIEYARSLDSIATLNPNYERGSIIRDTENNRTFFMEKAKEYCPAKIQRIQSEIDKTTAEIEAAKSENDPKKTEELNKKLEKLKKDLDKYEKFNEEALAFTSQSSPEPKPPEPTTSPTTTPRSADQELDEPKGTVRRKGSREHLGRQIPDENMKALRSEIAQAEIVAGKQQSAEPPAEPAASSEKTPPPSPREIKIGTHRPPQPDQSPQSPPASPRGNIKIGMQRTQSEEKLTSKAETANVSTRPRSKSETPPPPEASTPPKTPSSSPRGNTPPPPAYEAPGRPDEPPVKTTEKQKIGIHRSRSKETMAPTENRIQTTEQESSTELLNKTDELQSRVDQLQDRAVKLKEDAERRVERRQDLKLKVDERIVGRLENRINQLEKEKVKLAEMREKIAKRREELAQGTVTNPQAEHLLCHSKVQQEKVERASVAKAEAEADKTSSRRSSTSRGSERR